MELLEKLSVNVLKQPLTLRTPHPHPLVPCERGTHVAFTLETVLTEQIPQQRRQEGINYLCEFYEEQQGKDS